MTGAARIPREKWSPQHLPTDTRLRGGYFKLGTCLAVAGGLTLRGLRRAKIEAMRRCRGWPFAHGGQPAFPTFPTRARVSSRRTHPSRRTASGFHSHDGPQAQACSSTVAGRRWRGGLLVINEL